MKLKTSTARLSKYITLLNLIKKHCKGKCGSKYEELISYLDDKSVHFLCECIRNVLDPKNFSKLKHREKVKIVKKLTPYKSDIKNILKSSLSIKNRKRKLQKGGGFFLPLISAVLPIITSLISKKLTKSADE